MRKGILSKRWLKEKSKARALTPTTKKQKHPMKQIFRNPWLAWRDGGKAKEEDWGKPAKGYEVSVLLFFGVGICFSRKNPEGNQ